MPKWFLIYLCSSLFGVSAARAQSISASQHHTCATSAAGALYCWGQLHWGPSAASNLRPDSTLIEAASGASIARLATPDAPRVRFANVSVGWLHDCVRTRSGVVGCNGINSSMELGRRSVGRPVFARVRGTQRFRSITVGLSHSCGLTSSGRAYCWGSNEAGQTGIGSRVETVARPTAVVGRHRFRTISAGGRHTCGITTAGVTLCWGANTFGQLGRDPAQSGCAPDAACMAIPTRLDERYAFATIASGDDHTCAVTTDGVLFCWGDSYSGYMQTMRAPAPIALTRIQTPAPLRSLSVGLRMACGLTNDGRAYCWSPNALPSLGQTLRHMPCGSATWCMSDTPISSEIRFRAITVGTYHACGIGRSGAVYCWGTRDVRRMGSEQTAADHAPPCRSRDSAIEPHCAPEPFAVLVPNLITGELPRDYVPSQLARTR